MDLCGVIGDLVHIFYLSQHQITGVVWSQAALEK